MYHFNRFRLNCLVYALKKSLNNQLRDICQFFSYQNLAICLYQKRYKAFDKVLSRKECFSLV